MGKGRRDAPVRQPLGERLGARHRGHREMRGLLPQHALMPATHPGPGGRSFVIHSWSLDDPLDLTSRSAGPNRYRLILPGTVERHTDKRESPSSALGFGLSSGRRRREQVLGEQVYTRRTGRAPSCRPGRRGGRELCTPEGGDKTEGEFESRPGLDTEGARDVGARAGGG